MFIKRKIFKTLNEIKSLEDYESNYSTETLAVSVAIMYPELKHISFTYIEECVEKWKEKVA